VRYDLICVKVLLSLSQPTNLVSCADLIDCAFCADLKQR